MSEIKFTPGPWLIAGESATFVYALGPEGTNVFWCDVQAAGRERASRDELIANAHLIAAAPELYEALESARTWVDECGAQAGLQAILDEIDAALAKARGES